MQQELADLCGKYLNADCSVSNLRRLTGGANMETWAFDYGGTALILRRLPGNAAQEASIQSMGEVPIETEAAVIGLAGRHGVTVPRVVCVLPAEAGLGRGFIMTRVEGETIAKRIQSKPEFVEARAGFVSDCARELAAIHAISIEGVLRSLPVLEAGDAVATLRTEFGDNGCETPILNLAFAWLERNIPGPPDSPCLVHGDFRLGNLVIDGTGLKAVLDWETVHLGDPVQDLAYICTPNWRFAGYDKSVGGLGEIEPFLARYVEYGGQAVEPDRFRFWLIYSALWWAGVCLKMSGYWRSGYDRSLERAVIGRRVTEAELDLLLLLEGDEDRPSSRVGWGAPEHPSCLGATAYCELSQAIGEWIDNDLSERLEGRDRFQARVARNAVGMIQRRLSFGAVFEERSTRRLSELGMSEAGFLSATRSGQVSLEEPGVLGHLRLSAMERLYMDQPDYPGLGHAIRKWTA